MYLLLFLLCYFHQCYSLIRTLKFNLFNFINKRRANSAKITFQIDMVAQVRLWLKIYRSNSQKERKAHE